MKFLVPLLILVAGCKTATVAPPPATNAPPIVRIAPVNLPPSPVPLSQMLAASSPAAVIQPSKQTNYAVMTMLPYVPPCPGTYFLQRSTDLINWTLVCTNDPTASTVVTDVCHSAMQVYRTGFGTP